MPEDKPVDLSDLATGDPKDNPRRGPQPKPVSYILLWDRTVCACGAEYYGPRNGYNPCGYKKYWHPQKRGHILYPLNEAETLDPSLTREVETQTTNILLCPWCIYDFFTPTHVPGEVIHANAYEAEENEEEAESDTIVEKPEGEVSLDDLAEQEEASARQEEKPSDQNFTPDP